MTFVASMRPLILLILFLLGCSGAKGQDYYVALKPEKIAYFPATFYIDSVTVAAGVSDTLFSATRGIGNIIMQNGICASFNDFIAHNLAQDKSKTPLQLQVSSLVITVKQRGKTWLTNMSVSFAYFSGNDKVFESGNRGSQESNEFSVQNIEHFVRQSLEESIKKFDRQWAEHKNSSVIDDHITVNVIMGTTIDKENLMVYNPAILLTTDDFKGKYEENNRPEKAMTFSGIFMDLHDSVNNGRLVVTVKLTPYFSVTESWFKPEGRTPQLLAHEQTHFDITALKACEFANAIRKATFTKDSVVAILQKMEQSNGEAMKEEQDTYDAETNHSINSEKQSEWEQKIKEQVKTCGCY